MTHDISRSAIPGTPAVATHTAAAAPPPRRARDALIRTLAAPQHGIVTRRQLLAEKLPSHAIDNRVRDGRLVVLYRGVYRVPGPVVDRYEREMAAVLACGHEAVLSHGSAIRLWALGRAPRGGRAAPRPDPAPNLRRPDPAHGPVIEVSVVDAYRRPGPSVRVHRLVRLDSEDRATAHGIPVTAPARTILDFATTATAREVERAVARAEREGLAGRDDVAGVVVRYRHAPGAAMVRAVLARGDAPAFTRSEAEERFLALVRRARLPAARSNVVVEGHEVDFLWSAARLVVEVDGAEWHARPGAFERDRRRDAILLAAGYRVMRVTWRQLHDEPESLLVRLARSLTTPGAGRTGLQDRHDDPLDSHHGLGRHRDRGRREAPW